MAVSNSMYFHSILPNTVCFFSLLLDNFSIFLWCFLSLFRMVLFWLQFRFLKLDFRNRERQILIAKLVRRNEDITARAFSKVLSV